ncbi:zinc finger CCCH domain-containing protein 18-like isoform X2 [Carex littledalei]|uniref:Zinc finger CCCH domain-containing protein 18-like isoform X2 n=1 Tax=Carex littledalei TaxID=544730 RepID=A0A833QQS5_9POAL|nr:zinc finger CCCH domain-containing protein 18-like isoform X2 [Carex littledalei]
MVESGLFSLRERETDLVMDFAELAKIIYSRIQGFEPDNNARIFGCIFLRAPDEQEMMQLAYGSDATLISYINEAKADLSTKLPPNSSQIQSHNYPLSGLRKFSSKNPNLHMQSRIYDNFDCYNYTQNLNNQFIGFDEPYNNINHLPGYMSGVNMYHDPVVQRRVTKPSVLVPKRPCHYYLKDMCKNGANCSYSHHKIPSDFSESDSTSCGSGTGDTPASLEQLEMEIVELLRSNTGQPVSIASLPTLYGQIYGKGLQADGQYGPVRDVRIPCQDRRMFGFVSFHSPETVHLILANRHPHFICGARVLVKPYREKARYSMEKMKPQFGYNLHHTNIDPDICPMPGELGSSMQIKRQLYQEIMAQLELERMQLNELGFNPMTQISSPNYKLDNCKYLSDQKEFDSIDPLQHVLDALNKCPTSINTPALSPVTNDSSIEQDSCPVELPENPFGTVQ